MQNGFSRYEATQRVGRKIVDLLGKKLFDTVIATKFLNHEGSQFTKILNWHRLIDKVDTDLIDGLKADYVIEKTIYTCVDEQFLELLKQENGGTQPTHIFVCGADTDCCVMKIATDLFEKGIMPIVLLNYCDSNGGPDSNAAGKLVMRRLIGRNAMTDEDIQTKEQLDKLLNDRLF